MYVYVVYVCVDMFASVHVKGLKLSPMFSNITLHPTYWERASVNPELTVLASLASKGSLTPGNLCPQSARITGGLHNCLCFTLVWGIWMPILRLAWLSALSTEPPPQPLNDLLCTPRTACSIKLYLKPLLLLVNLSCPSGVTLVLWQFTLRTQAEKSFWTRLDHICSFFFSFEPLYMYSV